MKNQYFGDINDFRKYGLLRQLSAKGGLSTAVCWMLTPDAEGSTDGQKLAYLEQPDKFSHYDLELFNLLHHNVQVRGVRDVHTATLPKILPGAWFHHDITPDDAQGRGLYFEDFLYRCHDADLVFFDPDNGMEILSTPYGAKNSSKYLYWREFEKTWQQGHSILIYQHFPRLPRGPFLADLSRRFIAMTGVTTIHTFQTSHVAFFLVSQQKHSAFLEERITGVSCCWAGQIETMISARGDRMRDSNLSH